MSIVMHPLTAMSGSPTYTADDFRHVVNPFLCSSNGAAFDCVAGVRAGAPNPLCSIDGLTVTVEPHCGVFSPWPNVGAYTYAFTKGEEVKVPDSTNGYKIAVVVEDPSQAQGGVPRGSLKVFPSSADDTIIPGLVLAECQSGALSPVAPILHDDTVLEVSSFDRLSGIVALNGQRAVVSTTGRNYVMRDGRWQSAVEVQRESIGEGEVVVLYGRSSCSVQVNGVKIGNGSWDSAACTMKVKEGWCPPDEVSASLMVENGGSNTGLVTVGSDGTIIVKNMGAGGSNSRRRGNVSWPVC